MREFSTQKLYLELSYNLEKFRLTFTSSYVELHHHSIYLISSYSEINVLSSEEINVLRNLQKYTASTSIFHQIFINQHICLYTVTMHICREFFIINQCSQSFSMFSLMELIFMELRNQKLCHSLNWNIIYYAIIYVRFRIQSS